MSQKVGEVYLEIGAVLDGFTKAVQDAQKRSEKLGETFDKVGQKIKTVGDGMAQFGKKMSTFVTLPILGIGAAAVKSAADLEQQQVAFETMLGSAEQANSMLKELNTFAAKTPYSNDDIIKNSQLLLNFGASAESILPTIQQIGDISSGSAEKMGSLTLAFAQMQSTGRLMGQDLLQMINAGFNPLQTISEKTGKSVGQLKDEMSKGAISAEDVAEAFKIATSEGGRFFQMSEKQSKTVSGQFSTVKGNLVLLGQSIGGVLLPAINDFLSSLNGLLTSFQELDEGTKGFIVTTGLILAAIGPVIGILGKAVSIYGSFHGIIIAVSAGLKGQAIAQGASTAATVAHTVATKTATIATRIFNAALRANPVFLIIGGVAALAGAVYGLAKAFGDSRTETERAAESQKAYEDALHGTLSATQELKEETNEYIDSISHLDRKTQIAKINKQIEGLRMLVGEKEKLGKLNALEEESLQQISLLVQKRDALEKQAISERISKQKQASQKWLDDRKKAQEKWIQYNEEANQDEISLEKIKYSRVQAELQSDFDRKLITEEQYNTASANLKQEHENNLTEIQKEASDRRRQMIMDTLNVTSGIVSSLGEVFSMQSQNRIQEIENEKTRRIEALNAWYEEQQNIIEASSATQAEYNNRMEALDQERARKEKELEIKADKDKRKIQREAAKRQKEIAITETIISTATAAMNAYKALAGIPYIGPALGAAAAAAVSALGAVKVGLIRAQPLPAAAEGIYAESPYIGGEAGPELAFPLSSERGRRAMSLMADTLIDRAQERAASPQEASIVQEQQEPQRQTGDVYLFGEKIGEFITKGTRDGSILIYDRAVI